MTPLSTPAAQGTVALPKWVYTSALASFEGDTAKVRAYSGSIHAGWEDTPEFETAEAFYAWAKAECDRRNAYLASLASPSPEALPASGVEAVREAAKDIIASRSSTYKAKNGRVMGIEDDAGEMMWIVPFDEMAALEAALAPARKG